MTSTDKFFTLIDLTLADFATFNWFETDDWDFSISEKFSQLWQLKRKQKIEATSFFNSENAEKASHFQQHKCKWSKYSDLILETAAKTADHSQNRISWFSVKWDITD